MFKSRLSLLMSAALLLTACTTATPGLIPPPTFTPVSPTSTVPPTPSKPNEYITIAQLNLWFHGSGCYGGFEAFNCSGKRNTSLTPALGFTYDSASADVIRQQIDWAVSYGVDAFSIEWTTPRGTPNTIEDILDDDFLQSPELKKMRWCLFYDLYLRISQTPGLKVDLSRGMDFDNPDVYRTFVADFDRFAQKYFSQPQYLKVDDRPVIYIWGTWNARGNYTKAFEEARQKVAARGYDVYIVGDIIRTDHFYPKLASVYDANTNFVFFTPGTPPTSKDVGEAAVKLDETLSRWEKNITGLKVNGRQEDVVLQPGFTPQFDNRLSQEVNGSKDSIYIPALNKEQVTAMAEVARKYAHPVGSEGWKLVWLNTWNCWGETTTFEPTVAEGPQYPAGNYQFDFVEVIRAVFGPEVFPPSP